MHKQTLVTGFFFGLLIFICYNLFLILSPFLQPLFWSGVVAFIFYPLYKKVLGLCAHAPCAAAATTLIVMAIAVPLLIFIGINVIHEIKDGYTWISQAFENGFFEKLIKKVNSIPTIQEIERSKIFQMSVIKENLKNWSVTLSHRIMSFAFREIGILTKHLITAVVNFLLGFLLLFFFFKDGEKMIRFVYNIAPLEEDTKKEIFDEISRTFTAVLRGQLVTSIVQSVTAGIIFWSLRLPMPMFFAGLTFFTSLIPIIGAAGIWLSLVGYLLIQGDFNRALVLFALGAGVISTVDNFIKPYVIGTKITLKRLLLFLTVLAASFGGMIYMIYFIMQKRYALSLAILLAGILVARLSSRLIQPSPAESKTRLPYLLLFLGILGGLEVYGLMGIFIAPVVVSLFFVLAKIFRERMLGLSYHPTEPSPKLIAV